MNRIRPLTLLASVAAAPLIVLAVAACGNGGGSASASPTPPHHTRRTARHDRNHHHRPGPDPGQLPRPHPVPVRQGHRHHQHLHRRLRHVLAPPPATGQPAVGSGATAALLGTTPRSDGGPQITYNGHPVYLFIKDQKPGDTNGEGVSAFGASWFALSPTGNQVTAGPRAAPRPAREAPVAMPAPGAGMVARTLPGRASQQTHGSRKASPHQWTASQTLVFGKEGRCDRNPPAGGLGHWVSALGSLDWIAAVSLRDAVGHSIQPGVDVIVDLSRVEFIDAVGISALVGTVRRVRALGGQANICGASPEVRRRLELAGVYRLVMGCSARNGNDAA